MVPKGVFLGTWKRSGLHAGISNAVYGSRNRRGRHDSARLWDLGPPIILLA